MVNITEDELKKLESKYVGGGTFGLVYNVDDHIAYKIYRDKVVDDFAWREVDNPVMNLPQAHFDSLIKRSKKLDYTGGIIDKLYVNGRFRGVVIPYYGKKKLEDSTDLPVKQRINISKQMIRNSKELSRHLIYTTDFKTNNVMIQNGTAQFIDLDDLKTHVCHIPNPIYQIGTVYSLGETIQDFMSQTGVLSLPNGYSSFLEREGRFMALTYSRIEDYLNKKAEDLNVLFFDSRYAESLVNLLGAFDGKYKIVMMIERGQFQDESLLRTIDFLRFNGVGLYDVIFHDDQDSYHNLENIDVAYEISSPTELKKVYKREQ